MATTNKETVQEEIVQEETVQEETVQEETVKEDRVEVFIPRDPANDEPNLFVSVNGVGYLLPKGKKSMVPPHIKAEIERSLAAQEKMDEHVDALLKEANAPLPGATV